MSRVRRSYKIKVTINGRDIRQAVIDPHYEEKHPDISDELILSLIERLDGGEYQSSDRKHDWEFFMLDRIPYQGKRYRLVWCMRDHEIFIGIINCFRR